MEGNKDEAVRCIEIAKSALASGDKARALKFFKIAQRLDHFLSLDTLLADCENSYDSTNNVEVDASQVHQEASCSKSRDRGEKYRQDHLRHIQEIRLAKDYYAILGVEKNSSVGEIRKAYKKVSLKVHPDKNKAPGAEEAFRSVCTAFKCLSDEQLRRNYDKNRVAEHFEFRMPNVNIKRRRRRSTMRADFFDEAFDPDELFRSFGAQQPYKARGMDRDFRERKVQRGGNGGGSGISLVVLFHILPILFFFLFACFPFSEPQYSFQKTPVYYIPKVTEKHGVEYYVKSEDFEQQFPLGSSARKTLEHEIFTDYRSIHNRHCHIELRRRQWAKSAPTPYCDRLQKLRVA